MAEVGEEEELLANLSSLPGGNETGRLSFVSALDEQALELAEGPDALSEAISGLSSSARIRFGGSARALTAATAPATAAPVSLDAAETPPEPRLDDEIGHSEDSVPAGALPGTQAVSAAPFSSGLFREEIQAIHAASHSEFTLPAAPAQSSGAGSGGYPASGYSTEEGAGAGAGAGAGLQLRQHSPKRRREAETSERIGAAQRLESRNLDRLLDTPRAKEALRRTGIQRQELQPKSLQEFHVNGDLPERQRMRFNHYEQKRQEKLKLVLDTRQRVVREEMEKEANASVTGLHSLQMMEQLMDQEAKRLDKELRSQVRYHTAVERENEAQLQRERAQRKREEYRSERRNQADHARTMKSQEVRAVTLARMQHQREIQQLSEQEYERAQASQIAVQLEEEIRLREFKRQKDEEAAQKSDAYKIAREQVELKNSEMQLENEARGLALVQSYENRLKQVEAKKEEAVKSVYLRGEEQQIRLMDVQENKARLERVDEHRRVNVAKQLDQQSERIENLMHLKESIVEQRRFRNRSLRSRAQNIVNCTPGPADYGDKPSCLAEGPAAKISDAKPTMAHVEGTIENAVARTRDNPPLGTYDSKVLRNGTSGWDKGGVTMKGGDSDGKPLKKSYLDEVQRTNIAPGPGNYDTNKSTMQLEHATKMRRDYVTPAAHAAPVWANPDTGTPGPAAYNLDAFQRKKAMQRQSLSHPALKKALA